MTQQAFTLDAKYTLNEGTILLSGLQALVRLPLDQRRADLARGLNTAGLISGYRGSPLAGLDTLLLKQQALLDHHKIVFVPAINEDLGATAVFGSQLANRFPGPRYDGVFGMWYGKAPGVDRSGDVFKHANLAGVARHGGVLAVAGDDPACKSSTIPSASEVALYDALMPVLAPGTVQEILDLGRLGFELSRYAGLWVGFKVVTNVADAFATAEVAPDRVVVIHPELTINGRPWRPTQNPNLVPPYTAPLEQELFEGRLRAAEAFAAANRLNRIRQATPADWIGLVAAGQSFYELRQALADLGLDDEALARYGVRLLHIGMIFPLEKSIVRAFARGLEEIIVVEEKRAFLELFVRDALYHLTERPAVVGKADAEGRPLIPADGELDAARLAPLLARRLRRRLPAGAMRLPETRPAPLPILSLSPTDAKRTPYYCSGCPHNRSTVLPAGSLAGAGIGCHAMGLHMDVSKETLLGVTQMGGEGAQWVGAAPFTTTPHLFQNLGDGTLAHSGSLAIRQAVAAGTTITYKILYNKAVGMTGGQEVDGTLPVPELTRALEAEGVRRIIVTTENPSQYPKAARWAPGVEVWHRDRLDEAQRTLRDTPGVTVLIHDQGCAAELRRLRKRGKAYDPPTRVFINEAVCEGCGDCGVKSNCLSVQPVETEFGRKTQIHQPSCNKDYSCLMGDCPAFITVEPAAATEPQAKQARRKRFEVNETLPEPARRFGEAANVLMLGIGGTGVVTVNQVLGTAALLEGKHVGGLDQTGLSQKGGPVVSHLKIMPEPIAGSTKLGAAQADVYLAFDILTATQSQYLARAEAGRTLAIAATSQVPTGGQVSSTAVAFPAVDGLLAQLRGSTELAAAFDAVGLAEHYFGDSMAANMIVLGAAYQAGALPVNAASIEQAIGLNGVQAAMNTHAFRLGRRIVADPAWLQANPPRRAGAVAPRPKLSLRAYRLIEQVGATGELRRLLEIRVPELIAYQNYGYARRYSAFVRRVREAEAAAVPGQTRLSEAVARYLFKLMAYKDEYEVARLTLTAGVDEALAELFGPVQKQHYHLHPPLLRKLGMRNKLKLGRWFDGAFRVLLALKFLRGTPLDLFGYDQVRQVERALIGEYQDLLVAALAGLTPATYERAVQLAELPDSIRGYEAIKLANVEKFRAAVRALGVAPVASEVTTTGA